MASGCDWTGFYTLLCERGAQLLGGLDDETREVITLVSESDRFWSDGLQSVLEEGVSEGTDVVF